MISTPHFEIHTPLLAMKSIGRHEEYITLSVGVVGEILDAIDSLIEPGFVTIRVGEETLYTFARDLQQNAIIESMVCNTFD
jgi:hypothetical protein